MAADKATHHFQHHKVPGRLKTSLIVLGLIAAGMVAVTAAEDMGRPLNAVKAPAAQSLATTSINGTMVPDKRLSTDDYLSHNLNDRISSPTSGPRECRPDQGIVNACTFE